MIFNFNQIEPSQTCLNTLMLDFTLLAPNIIDHHQNEISLFSNVKKFSTIVFIQINNFEFSVFKK
jgi:hypothetical protein